MKNFFENLSKYQRQLMEKANELRLKEKLSQLNTSEIIDKAKYQYSKLDKQLRNDKINMSKDFGSNDRYYQNNTQSDFKKTIENSLKSLNLDKVADKLKNIDTGEFKELGSVQILHIGYS